MRRWVYKPKPIPLDRVCKATPETICILADEKIKYKPSLTARKVGFVISTYPFEDTLSPSLVHPPQLWNAGSRTFEFCQSKGWQSQTEQAAMTFQVEDIAFAIVMGFEPNNRFVMDMEGVKHRIIGHERVNDFTNTSATFWCDIVKLRTDYDLEALWQQHKTPRDGIEAAGFEASWEGWQSKLTVRMIKPRIIMIHLLCELEIHIEKRGPNDKASGAFFRRI
jgi:hypothetical protein